jgi:hypothetical protein
MKYVPPSVKETAFNCPHCGALAKQAWCDTFARGKEVKRPLPIIVGEGGAEEFNWSEIEDEDLKKKLTEWANKMATGVPFLELIKDGTRLHQQLHNVNLSICFNCNKLAVWIYDRLAYPHTGEAPAANPDMPDDIRRDYEEAGTILDQSPRGAAALIRLAIQKLCKELGQPGKNINDDIGALVKGGLDPRVQQALDAVRVIGNSAVHPGQIDLRDDRATAETLFKLLNLIVDKTISEPKHVAEVYASLPEGAVKAIEKRDGKLPIK